jgi:copper chaperone CopZ
MQNKEEYKQQHGYYPDENPHQVPTYNWNFKGNGHWEFTGDLLQCYGIPAHIQSNIQHLSAPKATEVELIGYHALTSINAPMVKLLDLTVCKALTSINAPSATTVKLTVCNALTNINTPSATTVKLMDCNALTKIDAPKATKVSLLECNALTSINTPNATIVEARSCNALTNIDAPKATKVALLECNALTNINAPKATDVTLMDCSALINIDAPKATDVTLMDCNALTNIDVPNATEVSVDSDILAEIIIRQLKNPQNLNFFKVQNQGITQDIKNADMELNGSAVIKSAIQKTQDAYEKKMQDVLSQVSNPRPMLHKNIIKEIAKYISPTDGRGHLMISELPDEVRNQVSEADQYKKQNIAEKTKQYTAVRTATGDGTITPAIAQTFFSGR